MALALETVPGSDSKVIVDKSGALLADKEEDSPVIRNFKRYSLLMKNSQDKYERIFKARRDITIESKRIIFLLHTIDRDFKRDVVFCEASERIKVLIDREYKKIAQELEGEDPYRFHRVISPGNQEFIEAVTLLEYMQVGVIKGLNSVSGLPFVPNMDYILGLADLTGELMRRSVASVGSGNVSDVSSTRSFLREVYIAMMGLSAGRELASKLTVLETNLCKVERICYNLHVLGSEVPKHVLACVETEVGDVDEGYRN